MCIRDRTFIAENYGINGRNASLIAWLIVFIGAYAMNALYSLILIVKNNRIISDGYNGTPSGFENFCEDDEGYTKWYVLHAEANAITKVASSTQSCDGATLYITLSPCKQCSKLIYQAKIKRLVYAVQYKDTSGIEFLKKAGVIVDHIKI